MRVSGLVVRDPEQKNGTKNGREWTVTTLRLLDESTATLIDVSTFGGNPQLLAAKTGDRIDLEVQSIGAPFQGRQQLTVPDKADLVPAGTGAPAKPYKA